MVKRHSNIKRIGYHQAAMTTLHLSNLASLLEAGDRMLSAYQVDARTVFARAGIERSNDPDARVTIEQNRAFWREAKQATGDPCLGFALGRAIVPANLHAVGYAILASRTILDGLDRLARYDRMLTTGLDLRVDSDRDPVEVSILEVQEQTMPQEGIDASFCVVLNMCRAVTDANFTPATVTMTRDDPPCAASLAKYFGCPIRYTARRNMLAFDRAAVTRTLTRQNPAVARASDEVVHHYLARFDHDDILLRVRLELMDLLPRGTPTRAQVAQSLHLSERTLQRRLAAEGCTFRELLADTRRELALSYINQRRHSVLEIGFLLGFTDPSNFARAFRAWTGQSPTDYREHALKG
jgi:AraC-like DNA-binding protein